MARLILTRLAAFVLTLIAASVVLFVAINVLPGSASGAALGIDATPQAIARFEAERGLDRSVVAQYGQWLGNALSGDFGTSFQNGVPVGPELLRRLPVTLELALLAFLIANLIAIPLGIATGARPHGPLDRSATVLATGFSAIPNFVVATVLVMLFAIRLHWLPPSGFTPFHVDVVANLQQMVMPALALGLGTSAILLRMLRTSVIEVMGRDYIRTARGKGAPPGVVLLRHATRNALIPYANVAAMEFSFLFGSVVVIEDIFLLPGVGSMVLVGILDRDYPVLLASTLAITAMVLVANLLADIAAVLLDPRRGNGAGS